MKRSLVPAVVLACCLTLLAAGRAASAPVVNQFGVNVKVPGLTAGRSYAFVFRLYDAASGGSVVFQETRAYKVPATLVVAHALGSVNPAGNPLEASFFSQQLWLQVSTGAKIYPRTRIGPGPYALGAQRCDDAALLNGHNADYYLDATNFAAGTISDELLSSNVARLDADQSFTGLKTFNPSSGSAPFAVEASKNARVAGLNADLLDGQHAADFAAAGDYLTQADAATNYLSKTDAASSYLTQAGAAADYLTITNAATAYLSKTSGVSQTVDMTNSAATTLTVTNSGSGAANLAVEGAVSAASFAGGSLSATGVVRVARAATPPAACDSAASGGLYFNTASGKFYGCDGASWQVLGFTGDGSGNSAANAGLSCKSILNQGQSIGSGIYWIDPSAGSTADAYQAYCDMTSSGGGWTLWASMVKGGTASTGLIQTLSSNYMDVVRYAALHSVSTDFFVRGQTTNTVFTMSKAEALAGSCHAMTTPVPENVDATNSTVYGHKETSACDLLGSDAAYLSITGSPTTLNVVSTATVGLWHGAGGVYSLNSSTQETRVEFYLR